MTIEKEILAQLKKNKGDSKTNPLNAFIESEDLMLVTPMGVIKGLTRLEALAQRLKDSGEVREASERDVNIKVINDVFAFVTMYIDRTIGEKKVESYSSTLMEKINGQWKIVHTQDTFLQ